MAHNAKARATQDGIAHDVQAVGSVALLEALKVTPRCPACGIDFEMVPVTVRTGRPGFPATLRSRTPSLDKLVPALGYVRGNVAIICWRCNALKRDGSLGEIAGLARWLTFALADEATYEIKDILIQAEQMAAAE